MTPQQLSVSEQATPTFNRVSPSAGYNEQLRSSINFYYGETGLRLLTFLWIYWAYTKYLILLERPSVLFSPTNFITNTLMPALPGQTVILAVVAVAVACNGYLFLYRKSALFQALLLGCLYWLNMPQWSFGYLSHVNHLFLLAHLFLIFVKVEKPALNRPSYLQHLTIKWFYAGILVTYTMAGIWKVVALGYKLAIGSSEMHWLHPDAALFNAVVSYRLSDIPFDYIQLYTPFPYFWQLSFLAAVYIQTFAVVAAFRPPLRFWIGMALLLLHIMNAIFFQTYFVVASLVLVVLFLPYCSLYTDPYIVNRLAFRTTFTGKGRDVQYERRYFNGDVDLLYGFEAYRERFKDKQYDLAGLLYFPGIKPLAKALLRLKK